jgi:hypothetical protein
VSGSISLTNLNESDVIRMSLEVLENGKYQGCRPSDLNSDDLWTAHRGSYYDFADSNLIRTEKRRRAYLSRKHKQDAFDARKATE